MASVAAVAASLAPAASASVKRVPCKKLSFSKYECSFYPPGNGISAGAPVQDATGKRVGYLNQGRNWIICQASGATVRYHGYFNRWWGYTEANDRHMGWVNAVYARGGSNNGQFAAVVPNCGSTYGSPPASATGSPNPRPTPKPSPRKVPCHSIGNGKHQCFFYRPGDGIHRGTPVFAGGNGPQVGYLNYGYNWVLCQQKGTTDVRGNIANNIWAYTEANDRRWGWVNAIWARGGSNWAGFSGVPNCRGSRGNPPGVSNPKPKPPPKPKPRPKPPVPTHNYDTVALGDSYSSGLGNPTYYDKAPCWRSWGAYAWILALDLNLQITDFEACNGATTSSVLYDQVEGYHVGGLSPSTGVVTLTVGGNDADFIGVLGRCIISATWCKAQLRKERPIIRNQLPGRLDTLYQAIKQRAPNAKVIVLGYPYLFGPCGTAGGLPLLRGATDLLDNTIRAATRRNHVYFVDTRAAFTGHSECDQDAWINHFYGGEPWVSFHPNQAGWNEDALLIEAKLWRIGW